MLLQIISHCYNIKTIARLFFKFFDFLRIVFELYYFAHPNFLDVLPFLTLLTLVKTYKSKSPRDHCYHFDREAIKMKAFVLLALSTLASAQIGGQPRSKYNIFLSNIFSNKIIIRSWQINPRSYPKGKVSRFDFTAHG